MSTQIESTAYPQNKLTLCKTCSKQIFFVRKLNADSDLRKVEKKFPKMPLICFCVAQ